MQTRSFPDRVRHSVLFEVLALAIFTPGAAWLFDYSAAEMGIIGVASATIAMLWNFIFNLGFDHVMLRLTGRVAKNIPIRVAHAFLFEAGLIVMLIPLISWYLGISIYAALMMDIVIVVFYLVYAFFFNLTYDHVFPIGGQD